MRSALPIFVPAWLLSQIELRKALLEYARTLTFKLGVRLTPSERGEILRKIRQTQTRLWPITEKIITQGQRGPIEASLVSAINDLLDQYTVRLAAAYDKLPTAVVWILVLIAAACLALTGFNAGISGRMSRWRLSGHPRRRYLHDRRL
jgi:hypothetical protein